MILQKIKNELKYVIPTLIIYSIISYWYISSLCNLVNLLF